MSGLMAELNARATEMGVPLSVQLDVTYRCNERCVHCYLDHEDHGEMSLQEIKSLLDQFAEAGVFFITLSGGEVMMRLDFFDILEYARSLMFSVKIKSNGFMIQEKHADRLRQLGVQSVQISIYSHRPEVHDAITKLPGSLKRSLDAILRLKSRGLHVVMANVLMAQNMNDYEGVRTLSNELGVSFVIDPTITPKMDGDRSILGLGISRDDLRQVFHNPDLVGPIEEVCAPPPATIDEDVLDASPCSAGHSACYVSPYGDVYPCVQFPLPSGNVRTQKFLDIWRHSMQLKEVRSIRLRDLSCCSGCNHFGTCTRCPGLAYMEGDMRGPSSLDCEKSLARTGILSPRLLAPKSAANSAYPSQNTSGFVPLAALR